MKRYSDEQVIAAVRLLALRLWRSPLAKDWQQDGCRPCHAIIHQRWKGWDQLLAAAGLPAPIILPAFGVSPGHRRYWTRTRIIDGMKKARAVLGRWPLTPDEYDTARRARKGQENGWPTIPVIRSLAGRTNGRGRGRGAWRRGMAAAGFVDDLPGWSWCVWTEEEDAYLLENAGHLTLKRLGFHLGRSVAACRRRLYDHGTRARDARGYYTASVLAQELEIPLTRVLKAIYNGRLKAQRPAGRPYWQINPESVEAQREWLTRPKVTHTSTPPVTTDWYKQHGLRRNGRGQITGKREAVHA